MSEIVRVTGVPEIEKRLEALDPKDRQNLERRAVRAGAKPIAEALRHVAAASRVPRSFSANSAASMVHVSASMRSGGEAHAVVRPKSPLFNIFQPGARGHEIKPRTSGLFLSRKGSNARSRKLSVVHRDHPGILAGPGGHPGWDETGRKRGRAFFSTRPVHHPGMAARDLLGPASAAGAEAAISAMAAVIFGHAEGQALG